MKNFYQIMLSLSIGLFFGAAYLPFSWAGVFYLLAIGLILKLDVTFIATRYAFILLAICLIWYGIENSWFIYLVFLEGHFLYLVVACLLVLVISLVAFAISLAIYLVTRAKLRNQPALRLFIGLAFSKAATGYIGEQIGRDWYLGNHLLENYYLSHLFSDFLAAIGAINTELIITTSLFLLILGLLKKNYRSLFSLLLILCLLVGAIKIFSYRTKIISAKNINLAGISSPVNGDKLDKIALWDFYIKHLDRQKYDEGLLIMPESAYDGIIEHGPTISQLLNQKLLNHQTLLIGADRVKFAVGNKLEIFNSAYLLKSGDFNYQIQEKEFLTPGAEYSLNFMNFFDARLIDNKKPYYTKGKSKMLTYQNQKLAVGLCLEGLLTSWHEKMLTANFYVILAREYRLPKLVNQKVARLTNLKMRQTARPWVKVSAGGESMIANYDNLLVRNTANEVIKGAINLSQQRFNYYQIWHYSPILWLFWFIIIILVMPITPAKR
ncbi:MAG: hypothetical protein JJV97_01940 [SAR324 cluster bacterium]|nr:hypothetical protein [SAR324 cluster bacterium]